MSANGSDTMQLRFTRCSLSDFQSPYNRNMDALLAWNFCCDISSSKNGDFLYSYNQTKKMNTITSPAREFLGSYSFVQNNQNMTLAEEYLTWKASYTKSASKAYRIWIKRFQEFVNKPPEHIALTDVTNFLHSISGLHSEKTIWYAMTIIRNYLRYFKEQGRITLPLHLVRVPSAYSNSHYSIREDEYAAMIQTLKLKHPDALRDRLIIRMLHDTGLRVGELCSLDLDDIHDDMSATIRTEKTIHSRRVFWNPDTEQDLQNYLHGRIKNKIDSDALFLGASRNSSLRLTNRSMQRIVAYVAQSAKIANNVTPHSFRHAFIHRVAKLGVPDAIIAVLVGHTTPHTIAHYTKLSRTEYEEAFRRSFSGCESPFRQILATAA